MSEKKVIWVDTDKISPDPNQPRTVFNDEEIASTAFTIESQGIINPIEVDENYVIVTGEIRWRAAQKAGLKRVPCIIWQNGSDKRFERQVVENLHHHQLSDRDREAAIVKLWKTKQYPNFAVLGKAVGLSRDRVNDILEASEFREANPNVVQHDGISTRDIQQTRTIKESTKRIRILEGISKGIIKSSEVNQVVKLAKSSDALLDKVLEKQVPLDRALEAAETIDAIEKKGVGLTDDQKQNLADKVAEDETILDKYKDAVLERVRQVTTAPKTKPRIEEPIGRTSPVNNIIDVKNEVMDHFKIYLGNCDVNERRWAKKTMIEIRDELSLLIEMIHDE